MFLIVAFLALNLSFAADKVLTAHIEYSATGEPKKINKILLKDRMATVTAWQSTESNCYCNAEFFSVLPIKEFNFSCNLPNGYRTQVYINCEKHMSKSNAASFFMCANFNVWCEY